MIEERRDNKKKNTREKKKKKKEKNREKKEIKVKNVVKCNFLFFASDNHFFSFVYIVSLF